MPCTSRPLSFHPLVGKTYRFSADERLTKDPESTRKKHYESQVVFAAAAGAWSAEERAFAVPFTPWNYEDPSKAVLHWTLEATGIAAARPTVDGFSDRDVVEAMSLFRFRTATNLPSTCVGDTHEAAWTELGRPRSISTRVISADDGRVRLHMSIERGAWHQDGEIEVSFDDGLTGTARLHELGPEAPRLEVNDIQRVIAVAHD